MTAEKFIRETKGITDSDFMDSGITNRMIELCEEYHKLASDGDLADVSKCQYCRDVSIPKGDEYCDDCEEQLKDI